MVLRMRDFGIQISNMGSADFLTLMEAYIQATLKTTKLKGLEYLNRKTKEVSTSGSGKITIMTDLVEKNGMMEVIIKDSILIVIRKV